MNQVNGETNAFVLILLSKKLYLFCCCGCGMTSAVTIVFFVGVEIKFTICDNIMIMSVNNSINIGDKTTRDVICKPLIVRIFFFFLKKSIYIKEKEKERKKEKN